MTGPTSWEVLVLYKDCNTETKFGVMKLHLMFGHKSNKYIKEAIKDDPTLRSLVKDIKDLDKPMSTFCSITALLIYIRNRFFKFIS